MAKTNSINNETSQLTIDPGASGDSWVQFSIGGTGEFRIGVDDNDGDAFKISLGSALGTNDAFVMTAAGERTMPLQPSFLATASLQSNVTGDNTNYSVLFATEIFDQGGDFSSPSFEAPVTGLYVFSGEIRFEGIGAAHTAASLNLSTSNRNINNVWDPQDMDLSGVVSFSFSSVADMDSADTVVMIVNVTNGTKVVDISATSTYFSGYLAC